MPEYAAEPLPVGTTVHHRYKVLAVVGRGGLGTVYQVGDVLYGMNNVFALKELTDQSAGARKQFELESQWLQSLNHNHIPKVREHFESERRLYLVMDFVDGENLEQKLARQGGRPLVEQQVLSWILPICDALHYLHTRLPPILHRDVKPANIIVTSAGHPVLVDLGIAKEHLPGAGMTATFVRKAGTEGYAPPEQYTAAGQTGPWSDVYGLGATLYQLLTGGLPPTAVERVALDVRLLHPRNVNSAVSPRTDAAIFKALAIRPVERFQTMQEFAQALSGVPFLASSPPPTFSPMASPSPVPPSQPQPSSPALPSPPPSTPSTPRVPASPPSPSPSPRPALPSSQPPLPPLWDASGTGLPRAPSPPPPLSPAWPITSSTLGLPGEDLRRSESPPARHSATGQLGALAARQTGTVSEARSRPALPSLNAAGLPELEQHTQARRRRVPPIVIGVGAACALLVVVVVALGVLQAVTPPDRSSAQATINGYFSALSSQDYARAWQYAAASRNNVGSQADFTSGLRADDAQYGRVLSARIVTIEEDNGGKTSATVNVTRASSAAALVYSLALTQYGGDTWLISAIATT